MHVTVLSPHNSLDLLPHIVGMGIAWVIPGHVNLSFNMQPMH